MRSNRAGGWIALLLLFLLDGISAVSDINEAIEYRLPKNVVPVSYDIQITPHLVEGNFTFEGESKVTVKVLNETSNIILHAYYDLKLIEQVTNLTDVYGNITETMSQYRDNVTDFLILTFEKSVKPGNYSLNFKFAGNISRNYVGVYRSSYINEKKEKVWLVATRFSPTKARRAFPCWDEPALRATFNMSIKHFPNYTAVSNMPVDNQYKVEGGKIMTVFKTTPTMSTYLVAFIVSDLKCLSNADKSINVCANENILRSMKFVLEIGIKAVTLLSLYTKVNYTLPKLDNYAIPDAETGGMANWGLIIYRESSIVINNETSLAAKEAAAEVFIHEVAHQWFGNLVSPAWWKYVWLKEGLSQYFQFYISNQIFPDWDMMNIFVSRILQDKTFAMDSTTNYNYLNWEPKCPVEIKSHFSSMVYNKGAVIMYVLSHILSEEVFQRGLHIYLKNHQYGVSTSDDFWNAMQGALNASNPTAIVQIKDVMEPWVEQKGYPIIKVLRDYEKGIAVLNQTSNLVSEPSNRWCVPINYATKSAPPSLNTMPTHWLKPNDANLTIDGLNKDDWLLVNINQSGYYRVDYDEFNWRKLGEYLNSDNYRLISVLNRGQMFNDLFYMALTDRQNFTTFFELSKYLSREIDLIPWRHALSAFKYMKRKIMDDKFEHNVKKYVLNLMEKVVDEVGFEERASDSYIIKRKRAEILQYACDIGHTECKAVAAKKLIAYLENPTKNSMPANLEQWILSSGSSNPKAETILENKIENGDFKYLKYLNNAKNKTFFRNYIENAFTNSNIPKNNTRMAFGHIASGSTESWDYAIDYFTKNFDRILKYFSHTEISSSILNDYILITPTLDRMKKIEKYVDENLEKLTPWVKNAVPRQQKKLEWSKVNAPILNEWIEKQLAAMPQTA